MKKTLGFVAVVALSGLITVSCSSLNKMKKRAGEITYSVTPETLVAKGGMVDLKIDVTFPAKYLTKKWLLRLPLYCVSKEERKLMK